MIESIIAKLLAPLLSSIWTWVVGAVISLGTAGYYLYRKWERQKLQNEIKELKWRIRKRELEEKGREMADENIDDPYDYLGK